MADRPKTALIVWDMQQGIASMASNRDLIVKNQRALIAAARQAGIPIIYSRHTGMGPDWTSASMKAMLKKRGIDEERGFMREGSPEWQILPELAPGKNDLVLMKTTPNFFVGTPLENLLRNRGIDSIVIAGVSTDAGVATTARHASAIGFSPTIIRDACGSRMPENHEMVLKVLSSMFEVVDTATWVGRISATKTPVPAR